MLSTYKVLAFGQEGHKDSRKQYLPEVKSTNLIPVSIAWCSGESSSTPPVFQERIMRNTMEAKIGF
jgi:hypothetical protein